MRTIRFIAFFLAGMFALACSDKGGVSGGAFENPLDQWVIPAEVRAGEEGIVQWNGFKEGAQLLLADAQSNEYQLQMVALTASGVSFRVPAEVPAGEYMLVLLQDGRKDLGQLNVLAMEMPVKGVKVPAGAVSGETFSISGIGFKPGCIVDMISTATGNEYELEAILTATGIDVVIPVEVPADVYEMWLMQDGMSWLLADAFEVYAGIVIKQLSALRYYAPYIGGAQIVMEWKFSKDPAVFTISEYLLDGGVEELNAYDKYVMGADGKIKLEHDGFESSNDVSVSYQRDSDGIVTVADVLIYGKSSTTAFAWTYDAEGRLVDISSPTKSFRAFSYDGGNLSVFRQTSFEYDVDSPANHPYAADAVWGYMSLMETNDPFVYFPYMLGWYAPVSEQLPARMVKPNPSGSGTVVCALSYEFDEDGYMTEMSWRDGSDNYHVEYLY